MIYGINIFIAHKQMSISQHKRIDNFELHFEIKQQIELKNRNQRLKGLMSSFKAKASLIKAKLEQDIMKQNVNHTCSQQQIKIVRQRETEPNQKILIQEPIIIEKKTVISRPESSRKLRNTEIQFKHTKKDVQAFVPVLIPTRDRKITSSEIEQKLTTNKPKCQGGTKEIEIQIEKDDKSKECLKKLFKKVHKLQQDLKQSEAQRIRLKLELDNCKNIQRKVSEYEKEINDLKCQKYKLDVDIAMLKKLLKDKDGQLQRNRTIVPRQIIKEVVVEKPVQIIVEVPKPVPGPERIVEKIIEIPKYIEIEKKVPFQVVKQVIKTIQVPTITQKIVYVDKPVYIDRQVPVHIDRQIPVQVPIQVPIEKPIYIDRPYVQQQLLERMRKYQIDIEQLMRINAELDDQNRSLRLTCDQLAENIEILRRHNEEKNREVEYLLQNSLDYNPCSPSQDYSLGSVKYTISSKNHPRAI